MMIKEITGLMDTFYGESLKKITIERMVIGVYFTGIKLSNGSCCFIHNIKGQGAPMSRAVLLSPTQTVPLACFSNGQAHIGSSMLAFARSIPLGGHVIKHVFGILQRYEAIG